MNGNKLLLDTNIALYLLGGDKTLANLLDQRHLYVSFITELELLSYQKITDEEQDKIRSFLNDCHVIDINAAIKEQVVAFRQDYPLKLPDSIILATAHFLDIPFITADEDFKRVETANLVLYER